MTQLTIRNKVPINIPKKRLIAFSKTALENSKAQKISLLDVHQLTDVTDYMVICTATSSRHSQSIANNLIEAVKKKGVVPLSVVGKETGEWILVDLNTIIIHIMLQSVRDFYNLEKRWYYPEAVEKTSV